MGGVSAGGKKRDEVRFLERCQGKDAGMKKKGQSGGTTPLRDHLSFAYTPPLATNTTQHTFPHSDSGACAPSHSSLQEEHFYSAVTVKCFFSFISRQCP